MTVGADKGYDTQGFVQQMRDRNVTPHVSQNVNRNGGSTIDGRTTRYAGYQVSQRKRKRIEEVFGWLKTVGMLRKTRHRGVFKVGWVFTRLQSGADEEPGGGSLRISSGRSVFERRTNRRFRHKIPAKTLMTCSWGVNKLDRVFFSSAC